MAVRRKQEEKNLQLLRELAAQPHNKQCMDCGQRGPTYVNMTIGSFVCTSCSGRLRGLTPPNRVKSISMASFSAEEIEFIKQRGNEWCKAVWLGLFDQSRHPEVDSKDDQQIKDFMAVKYEKKRYYVDPSVAFKERPAGAQSSPPPAASATTELPPDTKPLSKLVGAPVKPITLGQSVSLAAPARPAGRKNVDLLTELSPAMTSQADPFSPNGGGSGVASAAAAAPAVSANFANFANFDAMNASAAPTGARQPARTGNVSFANFDSAAALSAVPLSTRIAAPAPAPATSTGDRYAALKELDEVLKAEVDLPKVDWTANARDAAAQGQGWAAFGPVANGAGPYGQSPQQQQQQQHHHHHQQQQQQQHTLAAFPAGLQFTPTTANGFSSGNPWQQPAMCPPAAYSPYGSAGYGGYRVPFSPSYGAPPDLNVSGFGVPNGVVSVRPGQWGSPGGQQMAAWGAAAPTANPFMSSNGTQPVNPHNPFL